VQAVRDNFALLYMGELELEAGMCRWRRGQR